MSALTEIELAEAELKLTTDTYKKWAARGDPNQGHWGNALNALKRAKLALAAPPATKVYPSTTLYPSDTLKP